MKKILVVIVLILITPIFLKSKEKQVFNDTYDIIYKNNEVGITFILENNTNIILINDEDNITDLIVLDYKNIDNLNKVIDKLKIPEIRNIYTITPVLINYNNKNSQEIKVDENNIIKFNYNSRNFCIYINESEINDNIDCNFVYMYKFNKNTNTEFGSNTEIVFQNYKNRLPINIQESLYENWIDLYTISPYEYTTLKILKDGYDTIIVPIIK